MIPLRYVTDFDLLQTGLARLDIPLSGDASAGTDQAIPCYLYRNPDGSIRWLWPANATQPDFLRFYHRGSYRARLFVGLVNLLFRLRLDRWIAHDRLVLYTTSNGADRLRQAHRWALFTGTPGPNRKLVIWYRTATGASFFAKIALARPAALNLHREARVLQQLAQQPFRRIDVPCPVVYGKGLLIQDDLATSVLQPINQLSDVSAATWQELVRRGWQWQPLAQTAFWQQARQTLTDLRDVSDARIPVSLLDKAERLMHSLNSQRTVPMTMAHGDCTPWNMMRRDGQLCLIDWELGQEALPVLYDLFHFVYQSAILIGNRGYGAIRQELDRYLSQPDWQAFCRQRGIDLALSEQLYLLHTLTYYLSVYRRQQDWHRQVAWLLTTWNAALTHWLHQGKALSDRQLVLQDLAFWLHRRPHTALKLTVEHLTDMPDSSDLDLCLPRPVAEQLTAYLQQHPLVRKPVIEARTFMKQLHLLCADGSALHVDLIWQLKRKAIQFMDATTLWQQATPAPHGLNVPQPVHTQTYLRFFYGLNHAPMPDRYLPLFDHPTDAQLPNESRRQVGQLPPNRGWRGLLNGAAYGWDTLRSFAFRRGMIITFSGVDGAGKSTVIEQTRQQIEKRLRQRVIVLRHRPSLLPILSAWKYGKAQAEQRAASTLPRQGTNQQIGSSLLRFGYYYADYLFGQFYVQVKYVWRGYIVLYDRYYFDFINDSRRSNIALPPALTTSLYRLLLKPRLNVFLYAPAEEILRRKQELDATTITDLTRQYLGLFERLQRRYPSSEYLPLLNQHLPRTLVQIMTRIQHYSL